LARQEIRSLLVAAITLVEDRVQEDTQRMMTEATIEEESRSDEITEMNDISLVDESPEPTLGTELSKFVEDNDTDPHHVPQQLFSKDDDTMRSCCDVRSSTDLAHLKVGLLLYIIPLYIYIYS
jgi:hypothetical protein